jgi:RNA polymerase sigma factor (sigma-70 family)
MNFKLFKEWKKSPSKKAFDLLVIQNRGLVANVAAQYLRVAPIEDLNQAGYIGVMTALERFNPPDCPRSIEALWYVFCKLYIRYEVQKFLHEHLLIKRQKEDPRVFEALEDVENLEECSYDIATENPDLSYYLSDLDDAERALVESLLIDGLTLEELEAKTGVSVEFLSAIFDKAWAKIQDAVTDEFFEG